MRSLRRIEIERIKHLLPVGAEVFNGVPTASFGRGARNPYTEFYLWLACRYPDGARFRFDEMHKQVYVGNDLVKQLREACRRWHKARGVPVRELTEAVNWSDFGSGPLGSVMRALLIGSEGFMVPTSSARPDFETATRESAWQEDVYYFLKTPAARTVLD